MFRIETHCHTAEVSSCSKVPAAQLVAELKRSSFDGAVITDHFYHGFLDPIPGNWQDKTDRYLAGYFAARKAGERTGLRIFCGLEFRTTENNNDYLVFGM